MNRMPSRVLSFRFLIEVLLNGTPLFSLPPKTLISASFWVMVLIRNGVKCFHPLTRKKFISQDVTFYESIPFFSSGKTSLQRENSSEEFSSIIPLFVLVPSFHFDSYGIVERGRLNLTYTLEERSKVFRSTRLRGVEEHQ